MMKVMQSLGKVFATNTSIHGFINVYRTRSVVKIFYATTLFVFWCFMAYQVFIIFEHYFQYPTTTTVTIQYSDDIKFPAVSVCPLNAIKQSKFEQFRKETNMSYPPEELHGHDINEIHIDSALILQHEIYKAMYNYPEKANKSGFQLEEIVTECTYNSRECASYGLQFKQWQHGMYGNCFTLSASSEDYDHLPTILGSAQGLHITFYLNIEEYVPKISPIIGAKFVIHPVHEPVFVEEEGFTVSTASMASVSMKLWKQKQEPPPYTNCKEVDSQESQADIDFFRKTSNTYENLPKRHTSKSCMKSCLIMQVINNFTCIVPGYVSRIQLQTTLNRPPPGTCGDNSALKAATNKSVLNHCSTHCSEPCEQERYRSKIVTSTFPSRSYLASHLKTWTSSNEQLRVQAEEYERLFDKISKNVLSPHAKETNDSSKHSRRKRSNAVTSAKSSFNQPAKLAKLLSLRRIKRLEPTDDHEEVFDMNKMIGKMKGLSMGMLLQQEILGIEVYFEDLNSEMLEEKASYTLVSLLSNVGGTLGLFVGMSIFSVLELCIFLANVVFCHRVRTENGGDLINF